MNSRNFEEIIIPLENREESLNIMKHHTMEATLLNFVASKWIELNDLSGVQYSANKNRRFKTPMVRSDLCD